MPAPGPDSLDRTLAAVMAKKQGNGYDPATVPDANIQAREAQGEVNSLLGAYRNPAEAARVLQEEILRMDQSQEGISRGDPATFAGTTNTPDGYYAASKESPTGSGVFAPGAESWNPNKATMNNAIRKSVYSAALQALQSHMPK